MLKEHHFNKAQFDHLTRLVETSSALSPELYRKHGIKRGLRNENGTGVLVGITKVGNVVGYEIRDGAKVPVEGRLYYRGVPMTDLVTGFQKEGRRGFEETVYLLLFGELPARESLHAFSTLLDDLRSLPDHFKEDIILKVPSSDIMNKLQRTILTLYSYDHQPDDTSLENVLCQSVALIAKMPLLAAYAYQAKRHYYDGESLMLHHPLPGVGTAENLLHLIRGGEGYTPEEVELLDLFLVLHAEHGGGNNSSFATHVVSSSGTDTYSAIATALGSLKGPKHGGANLMVSSMLEHIREAVPSWQSGTALSAHLHRILDGDAFDGQGLLYGMGHAVYTLSDPRTLLLKEKAKALAALKGQEEDFAFIAAVEGAAAKVLRERLNRTYTMSANVDLYSGFVLGMLGIPKELYTPLFAVARMAGWSAHRLEQILDGKIMRPGYVNLSEERTYVPLAERPEAACRDAAV